ncbi:hypothetical protein NDU88_001214 [Pleurodeles waltl]|uniref:Uncharacterized protein n=1 Tax=Pleurodeles waltl TaxID=8319 RepID=A0AAV7SA79_PLEWA|nr:hypothetical protein NDU88_001214 [Pleurodeles waltl]
MERNKLKCLWKEKRGIKHDNQAQHAPEKRGECTSYRAGVSAERRDMLGIVRKEPARKHSCTPSVVRYTALVQCIGPVKPPMPAMSAYLRGVDKGSGACSHGHAHLPSCSTGCSARQQRYGHVSEVGIGTVLAPAAGVKIDRGQSHAVEGSIMPPILISGRHCQQHTISFCAQRGNAAAALKVLPLA